MKVKLVSATDSGGEKAIAAFINRPRFDQDAEDGADRILRDVRANGDAAVRRYALRFDGARLRAEEFRVADSEIEAAKRSVPVSWRRAIHASHKRIGAFARAGRRKAWEMSTPRGGSVGERFVPLDRVGFYVPGGAAPLVSTALMTLTLGKVAGVPERVAFTPCASDKTVNPALLLAMAVGGATEIYRVGGVQAIGAMAFGTATIARVQKIVGPGNAFVTAAKRQVYGHVALDLVAGPSEIAVLADSAADARHVAWDLLSQAEHGTGRERALLVTTSARLARAVQAHLAVASNELGAGAGGLREVLRKGTLLVVVGNLAAGMELCNRFAPEHLELLVRRPRRWLPKVRCAGAIFLGRWTPESAGDFAAGPSHVLPTGGAAAMFSGLTVDDFLRRSSVVALSREDLREVAPVIAAFGEMEGLPAHARSAACRFDQP